MFVEVSQPILIVLDGADRLSIYCRSNRSPSDLPGEYLDRNYCPSPRIDRNIDLLIFDIKSADSPSIPLIEDISFEGDIVAFVPDSLPADVMANLSNRVTEVVVKPIDWQELKNKEYFR